MQKKTGSLFSTSHTQICTAVLKWHSACVISNQRFYGNYRACRSICISQPLQLSLYQKGKTNLDFTEARDNEWQWHQLDHMQFCTSLQTDNHTSTPPLSFFTGRMPSLPPNEQRQSTDGKVSISRCT